MAPKLVEELTPKLLPLSTIVRVLQSLLGLRVLSDTVCQTAEWPRVPLVLCGAGADTVAGDNGADVLLGVPVLVVVAAKCVLHLAVAGLDGRVAPRGRDDAEPQDPSA